MQVNIYQFIVSIPLFLVLAFGLGFIINMIVKTTWLPLYVYIMIAAFYIYRMGGINTLMDTVVLVSGLVGVVLSGIVMRILRKKGYSMF